MKTYARIDNGLVAELIAPFLNEEGEEVVIENRFTPEVVAALVEVPENVTVNLGDGYDGTTFGPPPPPPAQDPEAVKAAKVATVQAFMDGKAQALGYDGITTAITYADEPAVPKFQTEGQAFRAWRSLCWETCYGIFDAVEAGTQPIPTDEALLAALPTLDLDVPAAA
jgi:hypothetical protein